VAAPFSSEAFHNKKDKDKERQASTSRKTVIEDEK
jgi:hypothetical protein